MAFCAPKRATARGRSRRLCTPSSTGPWGDAVTRNTRPNRATIESFAADAIDVRDLQRWGVFDENWVRYGPSLRWPRITSMTVARYLLILGLRGQTIPQHIRVSWTRLHFGSERPWMHCPHCERRVARLYRGLAGYLCRPCVGNPPYATQLLSAGARAHFKACKLRLLLKGEAQLSRPFPERPQGMHRRTYRRLKGEGMRLEAGLSKRMRKRFPDYPSLVAYTD